MVLQLLNLPFRSVMAVALRLAVVMSIGATAYAAWGQAVRASETNARWETLDDVIRCASRLSAPLLEKLSKESPYGNFDVAPFGCRDKGPTFFTNMNEIEAIRLTGSYQMKYKQTLFNFDILFAVALSWFLSTLFVGMLVWSALKTFRWILKG
jgi:hypothetical protein